MRRQLMVAAWGMLVAAVGVVGVGCASSGVRSDQRLDAKWRFVKEDVPAAKEAQFDDQGWQAVAVPHTWNAEDGADGGNNYYRGPGWYRRHLTVGRSEEGKSLFLRFEGAATVSDVYVNGQQAGEHRGNFGAFCFDITPLVKPGDNVIAVRVDNAKFHDIAPLSGDFTIYGGIYRPVHLLVLDKLSVTPLDDAGPGVYLKEAHVDDAAAEVEVTTKVRNAYAGARNATVTCVIRDAGGKSVQEAKSTTAVAAGQTADVVQHVTIEHPHLWDGRKDPYLYSAVVEVSDGGRVTDRVVQPLGLRYFTIDPDKGFFLNGHSCPLHGVNRHQDRLGKGWAISDADHEQDFSLIMDLGCTGIRLSHYEHAQHFYELCDRGGLVAWAELCMVNQLARPPFEANAGQQLRELIKQNYNHPSIVMWSLFNELAQKQEVPDWSIVEHMNQLAHQLDPTRPTTAATHLKPEHPLSRITDVIAFNRYYGWYSGKVTDWPAELDKIRAALPGRAIGISEYGAGASIYQHENDPSQPAKTAGPWHPEEWQCIVHEHAYGAMKQRPWLWGTYLWCMFDFGSDGRHEGDHAGRNDKGLVTYDRKVKKDAYFYYQANWSSETVLHLTDKRFEPRPSGPSQLKVYSNCDAVELFLNGKSLGKKAGENGVFTWAANLASGADHVTAVGSRGGKVITDECTWHASAGAATRQSATQPAR